MAQTNTFRQIISAMMLLVALAFGQTVQATVTGSMTFEGFSNTNGNQSAHAWRIQGLLGNTSSQQPVSGTSQTFNNAQVINSGGNSVTINGTLNFAVANTWTDVTTGSEVTLVFESSNFWFYSATVKTLSDANVTGCSYSIGNERHTITVTIPSGKTFGKVYLDFVNHAPMTNSNTTVTVPAGDYWVSDNNHKPEPVPSVVYGNTTLIQDIDYTLSWRDNSSAGTGAARVTGMGEYTGIVDGTFPIRWATYTVHFDKNHNDATGTMSDQQFTYCSSQYLTANAFTRIGCTFNRWYTNPDGTGTSYTNGQLVNNLTTIDGETVTLYAKWNVINYNITYELNGGNANNPATYNIETESFTLNNPTKPGYTFDGWTGTGLTEATLTVTIAQGSMGDRSYTANWTPITYTVHFDKNSASASGTMDDMSFTYGVAQNLTANAFTRDDDYTFIRWNTLANGSGTSYNNGQSVSNLTTAPNDVVNLYAQWVQNSWQGSGSEDDPYIINSTAGLDRLAAEVSNGNNYSGVFFSQTDDIVYDGTENNFTPIGQYNSLRLFSGTYNGNGHTISGININMISNTTDSQGIGIFGCLNGANINNVILTNSTIIGFSIIGGIVGFSINSNISNCRVESSVTVGTGYNNGTNHGGIVGVNGFGTISGCYSAAVVTNSDKTNCTHYGGIVGENVGDVKDCIYAGNTVNAYRYIGAIIGYRNPNSTNPNSTITNNYYTAIQLGGIGYDGSASSSADADGARKGYTITLDNENMVFVGDQTAYNHSGITAIGESVLKYGNTYYSGYGQTVTLGPEQGFSIQDVTVNGNPATDNGNGTWSFTMPDANATVTATVEALPGDRYQLFSGALVEGDYLIVCNGKAMEHEYISAKFYYKEVTAIDNVITTDDADIIWHIAPNNEGYWTIYNDVAEKYAAESTKNGTVALYDDISFEQTHWIFSQYETSYNIVNRRFYGNSEYVYLSYRYGGINGFGCSDLSHGDDRPSLYKKVGAPVTETYTLEINGYTNDESGWHLIASPVSTPITPTEENGFLANTFDLYRFNQAADAEWENWKADGTDHYHFNLESGRGYLYANSDDVTLTFTGTPYVGNGSVWITNTHDVEFEGWNLVGNPWSVEATIDQDFYRMNDDGSEIVPATGNTVNPMEGIFVYTAFSGGYVSFTPYSPSTKGNNGNDASLVINLSKGNRSSVIDRAIVRFDSERTMTKLQLFDGSTKLYIPQDGTDYAIAFSNRQGEIPLNFKAKETGRYTISFEGIDLKNIKLIDLLENLVIDLSENPSYTFISSPADRQARFIIKFGSSENFESSENLGVFAYQSGNEIIITGEGELQIFDVMGRMIMQKHINGVETIAKPTQTGVYILKLNIKTQKIVVR